MSANETILPASDLQRRARTWHALAALLHRDGEAQGPLFSAEAPEEDGGVRRTEGALHVRGSVPVECLNVPGVMD